MLVANSFDLWQKDSFFSAAEEVQQSVDIMESAFRAWMRGRSEGSVPQNLEELGGELQMALGTAKWQLEEFERAVFLSYKSHGNDVTVRRHTDFISAMQHQISHVENALMDHFVEGKKPFRWVNLDEEECDDLADFLSGVSRQPRRMPGGENRRFQMLATGSLDQEKCLEDVTSSSDAKNGFIDPVSTNQRTRASSLPDVLEIVIDRNDRQMGVMTEEATPKDKASKAKSHFSLSRREENSDAKGFGWMSQRLRIRQAYRHMVSPVTAVKSIRTMLILMLTILLVVPFLMYSA